MRKILVHCFATVLLALASAQPTMAQDDKMKPTAIPAQPSAIPLKTGPLPDAKAKESWHSQYGSAFARNVTEATLTPFLPDPAKATGAAVIVAPGGGFRTLSMQNEGWDVAKALAARGIAAFVLKYRLNQTPPAWRSSPVRRHRGPARASASGWPLSVRRSPTHARPSRSSARGRPRGKSIRNASAWSASRQVPC